MREETVVSRKPAMSIWDRLKISLHATFVVDVGGLIDDHYASVSLQRVQHGRFHRWSAIRVSTPSHRALFRWINGNGCFPFVEALWPLFTVFLVRGLFKTLIEIGMLHLSGILDTSHFNPSNAQSLNHTIFRENTCLGIDIIFKPNAGSKDDWCTSRIHRPWSRRIFNKEVEGVPQCCSAVWRGQRALSFTFLSFFFSYE